MKNSHSKLNYTGEGTGKYSSLGVSESVIVKKIQDGLKRKYNPILITKTHGGVYQSAGIPDLYILYNGINIWIECKRPGGDTTALQKHYMDNLVSCGGYTGIATSLEDAIELIELIEEGLNLDTSRKTRNGTKNVDNITKEKTQTRVSQS